MKLLKKGIITDAAALAVGGIGAGLVYSKTAGFIKNDKLRAFAPVGVGLLLMSQKGKMVQGAGMGMVAVGAQKLIGAFVPGLAGYGEDDVIEGLYDEYDSVNGSVLNGNVVNGVDDGFDDGFDS